MNKQEALIGLNLVNGIGSVRLGKLLEFFGTPEKIFAAAPDKLSAASGINNQLACRIAALDEKEVAKELRLAKKYAVEIITYLDTAYPDSLKQIPGAPIVLYVKGRILETDRYGIAIVGSRQASFYGLSSARKFGAELSLCGFTIVSGMARGIDTSAHQGALGAGGRTIAVMGSGFAQIYPDENRALAEEISGHGAVVSEFPINTLPLRENFPRRNRLISGLSLGVLVVEAARNSGALITADFALEQGREVFALPGKIDAENSLGTNELIKQGAKLVCGIDDIMEEFTQAGIAAGLSCYAADSVGLKTGDLDHDEQSIYNLSFKEALGIDEIAESVSMNIPAVSQAILGLQLKRLIRELPGKKYRKIKERLIVGAPCQ